MYQQNKKPELLDKLENQLRKEDKRLKEMTKLLSNDISNKVWKRLNVYIKEYGEVNGYDIIMGTQGSGNVMYAKDVIDITNEILNYSNNRYEGS